mgnify:CR=1 FL=1
MFCFVISKEEYEKTVNGLLDREPILVCIGSVSDTKQAENIAKTFSCMTEIKAYGGINSACYIVCQV